MTSAHDSSIDDPATALLASSLLLGTARHPIPPGAAFAELTGDSGAMSDLAALARQRSRSPAEMGRLVGPGSRSTCVERDGADRIVANANSRAAV